MEVTRTKTKQCESIYDTDVSCRDDIVEDNDLGCIDILHDAGSAALSRIGSVKQYCAVLTHEETG